MKMKSSELTKALLNWAVAKCEGLRCGAFAPKNAAEAAMVTAPAPTDVALYLLDHDIDNGYNPSEDWAQGGPIIEREMITLEWTGKDWMAYIWHDEEYFAPTLLLAAMRCYVASKLGDEVDVPDELLEMI